MTTTKQELTSPSRQVIDETSLFHYKYGIHPQPFQQVHLFGWWFSSPQNWNDYISTIYMADGFDDYWLGLF